MKEILEAFDKFLGDRGLRLEATVVGGAVLIIRKLLDRTTDDLDVLEPPLTPDLIKVAEDFLKTQKRAAAPLKRGWLNNSPSSLIKELPLGWRNRLEVLYRGTNIHLKTLGRLDFLGTKLYTYCDRQDDLADCVALKPTTDELRFCEPWVVERDANPPWPDHVRKSFGVLEKALYGSGRT